jgi:hypothetical protein
MTARTALALLVVAITAAGCMSRWKTSGTGTGCCCALDNCRSGYSQSECVANAQFQGWTYTWHDGGCNSLDRYPASDAPPTSNR